MIDWWKQAVFENYANFNGRARRSEFWYFNLFNGIIYLIFLLLIVFVASGSNNGAYSTAIIGLYIGYSLFNLAMFIPSLAVAVRRLHDINKSGWAVLVGLIPVIGYIILIVWFATEGTKGPNQFGDNPKEEADQIDVIGFGGE